MTAAVPTTDSRRSAFEADAVALDVAIRQARDISTGQRDAMALGPVAIQTIIDGIYVPFVGSIDRKGFWRYIEDLAANDKFMDFYTERLGLRHAFDVDDVNLGANRIDVSGNEFIVGDPVQVVGSGTSPGGLTKGVNYWIFDKNPAGNAVGLKNTAGASGGSIINLTSGASGSLFLELRHTGIFNTLVAALEAVIDQIILDVPVTVTTLELRSLTFDKALASSTDGLVPQTLTSVQTTTLQAKLLDVINAVEAAV